MTEIDACLLAEKEEGKMNQENDVLRRESATTLQAGHSSLAILPDSLSSDLPFGFGFGFGFAFEFGRNLFPCRRERAPASLSSLHTSNPPEIEQPRCKENERLISLTARNLSLPPPSFMALPAPFYSAQIVSNEEF